MSKDKIYEKVAAEIKLADYQRRSLLEQMERTLSDKNIDSLSVLVYKYQKLSLKINTLKEIMYDIESQL